jgi:hypothetical protein
MPLEALGDHRQAVILVGAQAIYLHTGEGDLAVAAFTADGDLIIEPARLAAEPKLADLLQNAGFKPGNQVGSWIARRLFGQTPMTVPIDFLVPEAVGGAGRRAARLASHGKEVARKARGLEGALVVQRDHILDALDPADERKFAIRVAVPSALLVAKLHKIVERMEEVGAKRVKEKDALDVSRLLRGVPIETLAEGLKRLRAETVSAVVTDEAHLHLKTLFSTPGSPGSQMVVRATSGLEDPLRIAKSCEALAGELLTAIG